ncbi:hypothetical protein BOX15_Mlig010574g4, partial [Macrostomum lignano]
WPAELFLWQPGWQQPLRLRPRPSPLGTVTSACLTHRALLIGTGRGRGYRVDLSSPTRLSSRSTLSTTAAVSSVSLSAPSDSIPGLHRTARLFADPRGRAFASLQVSPRHFLTDLPEPPAPLVYADMADCLAELLDRAHETGADAELVGSDGVRIGAHRFLLADRSAALADWLINCCHHGDDSSKEVRTIGPWLRLVQSSAELAVIASDCLTGGQIYDLLAYLYCGRGGGGAKGGPLAEVCKALRLKSGRMRRFEANPPLAVDRCNPDGAGHFVDLTIESAPLSDRPDVSSSNSSWACHSALLSARSDYFTAMLMARHYGGWREATTACLSLPYPSSLLSAILAYLYTADVRLVLSPNQDLAPDLLDAADYLQLPGLRLACEAELAQRLHLRSFAGLAVLADSRNADRLLAACVQFAANNLPAMLESAGHCLAGLPAGLLGRLGQDLRGRLRPAGRRFQPIDCGRSIVELLPGWLAGISSDELPLPIPPAPSIAAAGIVGEAASENSPAASATAAASTKRRRSRGSSSSASVSLEKCPELNLLLPVASESVKEVEEEDGASGNG